MSKALLKKYNLHPKKGLGQNFLIDPNHLRKIIQAADLSADDVVLEIGPGLGALTRLLVNKARAVAAIELDQALAAALKVEIQADNFYLLPGDILKLDPAAALQSVIPRFTPDDDYVVVANLPYYITSAVLRHLLEAPRPPRRLTLTVQKEVARRITAGPGKMSLLAISVQFYGQPRLCHTIPPNAFTPPPKVDSAVLRVDRHAVPPVQTDDPARYFRVVKAGFGQKRKQLRNALAAGLHKPPQEISALLESAGIDPHRRAETLSLQEWALLEQETR